MLRFFLLTGTLLTLLSSCKKEKSDTSNSGAFLEVQIANEVDGQPLQLNTDYTNAFNEVFKLTTYKYYISNIELYNIQEAVAIPNTYYFIDAADANSGNIRESIKADTYNAISFWVGIDSTKQVSGNRNGVLDPANGLFWDPNLGYMSARLEGSSTSSGAPGGVINYQIGGFEGNFNSLRQVFIPLPGNLTMSSGNTLQVFLRADLLRWFDAIHSLPIKDNPTVITPGPASVQFANNYSGMFSLSSVEIK
jgi:hypothetical protein